MKRGLKGNIALKTSTENGISLGFVEDLKRRWEAFIEKEPKRDYPYAVYDRFNDNKNKSVINEKFPGQTKTPEEKR